MLQLPIVVLHKCLEFCNVRDLIKFAMTASSSCHETKAVAKKLVDKITLIYYPSLLQNPHWKELMPIFSAFSQLVRPRIIVVRGFLTFSLDLNTNTWKRCHDTRRDRGYFAAVYHQGEVYAIGTYSLVAAGTVEKYNPFLDKWISVGPLPKKLRSQGAASHPTGLYVTGGIESHSEAVVNDIMLYQAEADEANRLDPDSTLPVWEKVSVQLLRLRYRHAAVNFKGKIWIAGGCFENFAVTDTVEIFDPTSLTVNEGPSMLAKRDFANLLVVLDELYAVGGDVDEVGNQTIRTIEKFDETENKWVHITSFKDTRRGFSTCAFESKIFVFCGSDEKNGELRTWDAFDVLVKQWESTLHPNISRKMPRIDSWGQAVTFPDTPIHW